MKRDEFMTELLKALEDAVRRHYGGDLVTLALFGSVARGTHTPESDLDLLVIAKNLPDGRVRRVRDFMEHVEDPLEHVLVRPRQPGDQLELSPIIKTPKEVEAGSYLFLDMIEEALILVDRGDSFRGYLDRLREKLRTWGAHKVYEKGGYYWVLKPDWKRGEILDLSVQL